MGNSQAEPPLHTVLCHVKQLAGILQGEEKSLCLFGAYGLQLRESFGFGADFGD